MKHSLMLAAALAAALASQAQAQGIVGGAEHGAREGSRAAGPVGGLVGGVVGGVTGGVAGLLGIDQRHRFHDYVVERHYPSYNYNGDVVVGSVLPPSGLTYYEMPSEYGPPTYRYAIVNGHTVLVDPRTRQIVQILD